jgi:hypothetical protein
VDDCRLGIMDGDDDNGKRIYEVLCCKTESQHIMTTTMTDLTIALYFCKAMFCLVASDIEEGSLLEHVGIRTASIFHILFRRFVAIAIAIAISIDRREVDEVVPIVVEDEVWY